MLNTPILLIVFNRPDKTKAVLQRIREIKPRQLFVAADGPRLNNSDDAKNCTIVKDIITNGIDWDCELITRFSPENLGCGKGPAEGITWFFNHVEGGIILEDDCIPSLSFFGFCQICLDRYKDNNQIMHIGGNNFQKKKWNNATYFFSAYPHAWGWATWRRAWELYHFDLTKTPLHELEKTVGNYFSAGHHEGWLKTFIDISRKDIQENSAWDYQWMYCIWKHRGLAIYPNVNLVKNVGFGADATHTFDVNSAMANNSEADLIEIIHPKEIARNVDADEYTTQVVFGLDKNDLKRKLIKFAKRLINNK